MGEADLPAEPAALGAYDLSRPHHARQRFGAKRQLLGAGILQNLFCIIIVDFSIVTQNFIVCGA